MKFLCVVFICLVCVQDISTCSLKAGDKEINLSDQWEWRDHGNGNEIFSLSFCKPSKSCKNGDYVCKSNNGYKGYGKLNTTTSKDGKDFEFLLHGGDKCASDQTKNLSAKVIISCGRTLGELAFIEEVDCVAYFEFSSIEACHSMKRKNLIPCYIFNSDNMKIDLSSLQSVSSYTKANAFTEEVIFNVCGDINGETACADSAFCVKNNTWRKIGFIDPIKTKLSVEYNQVVLRYDGKTDSCSATLRFECPLPGNDGNIPIVTQSLGSCDYDVVWNTEHACPIKDQLVKNSCKINVLGKDYDLSVLKKESDVIKLSYSDSSTAYDIEMNICGPLPDTVHCNGDKSASVCQKKTDGKSPKVLGSYQKSTLRYIDKTLIYTMKNGEKCRSNFNRTTVITFHCDINALNTKPTFDYEDACTYFFKWNTNHACSYNRDMGSECRLVSTVNKQTKIYDLTPLTKINKPLSVDNTLKSSITLSVCGLLKDKTCGDSSLCIESTKRSLGKYHSKLQLLNDNDLLLHYSGGYECDGRPVNTSIYFHCAPGDNSSLPILKKSGCDYQIQWNTLYACQLVEDQGHRCSLYNDEYQMDFELQYLKPPNGKWFSVSTNDYMYQLQVCGGSRETYCNAGTNKNTSVGICQHSLKNSGDSKIVGLNSYKDLRYYAGILSMTLAGGDKCHRNHKNRSAEIVFLCNYTAGIGQPIFEQEKTHCFYRFIWPTKYACLPKKGICQGEVNGKTYDLTSLSRTPKEGNWKLNMSSGIYYINVCRPHITFSLVKCSPFDGICFESKTSSYLGYGSVSPDEPLKIVDGNIVMRYKFENGTCSVQITFTCDRNGIGIPRLDVSTSNDCLRYFIWSTVAACPVKEKEIGGKGTCSIKDKLTNVEIDLNILSHPYEYNATVGDKTYHVNVCKQSSSCGKNVAACYQDKDKKTTAIGKVSKQLVLERKSLTLTYQYGDVDITKTIITFYCNIDEQRNILNFRNFDKTLQTYYFDMETVQACNEVELQCQQSDINGKVYNLEPLRKFGTVGDYWSSLSRKSTLKFYLNLCSPMNNIPDDKCKAKSRACLVADHYRNMSAYSYNARHLQAFTNTVLLTYYNSQEKEVLVLLHCSTNQGSPYYQFEHSKTVIFNWLTPAACPITSNVGSSCSVTDSRREHLFDLSELKNSKTEFALKIIDKNNNDRILHVSVCRKNNNCHGSNGACLTDSKGKFIEAMGDYNENLIFGMNGKLSLHYKTPDGSSGGFVRIKFVCGFEHEPKVAERSGNGFIVEWPTPKACNQEDIECSVIHKNSDLKFDISPLSKREFNWQAEINEEVNLKNQKIFINVCRPLKAEKRVNGCSKATSICAVVNGVSKNIGSMRSSPSIDKEGHVVLHYTNGDICKNRTYSAKIHLLHGEPNDLGTPVLNTIYDDCEYRFEWRSSVAWHIESNNRAKLSSQNCTVENKLTGYVNDFSPLNTSQHSVTNTKSGEQFQIEICRFDGGKPQSKICKYASNDKSTVIQCLSNSNTIISNNIFYMKFGFGDKYYLINFICDMTAKDGKPMFVNKGDGIGVFVWRTSHACEHSIQCDAFDGNGKVKHLYKLKHPTYYKVNVGKDITGEAAKKEYQINICQNIVTKDCPHNSASCYAGGKQSLGNLDKSPVLESSGDVSLKYTSGDVCQQDHSKKLESLITIKCDNTAKKPNVILQRIQGCQYQFTMFTSLVCEEKVITSKNCTIKYNDGRSFDLKPLQKIEADYVVESLNNANRKYRLNMCGDTTIADDACKGVQVCMETKVANNYQYKNYGLVKDFQWKADLIYEYNENNMKTAIKFECDPKVSLGAPDLIVENITKTYSLVMFEWGTSIVCDPIQYPQHFKEVAGFFKKEIQMESSMGIFYLSLYSYRSSSTSLKGCPKTAAVCLVDKKNGIRKVYAIGIHASNVRSIDGDNYVTLEYDEGVYEGRGSNVWVNITCGKNTQDIKFIEYHKTSNTFIFQGAAHYTDCHSISSTMRPTATAKQGSNESDKKSSSNLKRRSTAIAVLAVCIVIAIFCICCGVLVSSKDRRITLESTIRSLFCCKKAEVPSYRYHKLTANGSEEEDNDDEELERITEADTINQKSTRRRRVSLDSFKDEETSDEELLRI